MARLRRLRPVAARDFLALRNSSGCGTVGLEGWSPVLVAISSGEPGDGGVLDRVVAELRFMEKRRVGGLRCDASAKFGSELP